MSGQGEIAAVCSTTRGTTLRSRIQRVAVVPAAPAAVPASAPLTVDLNMWGARRSAASNHSLSPRILVTPDPDGHCSCALSRALLEESSIRPERADLLVKQGQARGLNAHDPGHICMPLVLPASARPGCASAARRHWTVRGAGA